MELYVEFRDNKYLTEWFTWYTISKLINNILL